MHTSADAEGHFSTDPRTHREDFPKGVRWTWANKALGLSGAPEALWAISSQALPKGTNLAAALRHEGECRRLKLRGC